MSEKQQIIFMQARMLRLASEEWKRSLEEVVALFTKYNVLQYIYDCFEVFHAEGDEAILDDIARYLEKKGAGKNEKIRE